MSDHTLGTLRDQLVELVGDAHVDVSEQHGEVVVRPSSAAEVSEVVRLAGQHSAVITPSGSGEKQAASRVDTRVIVKLSLVRLNHVLRLDEMSQTVRVQAGMTALELERILERRGLTLGEYPPSALGATLGGLLAVRPPGKLAGRHGFIEDAVLGLSAVLADGRMVHMLPAPRRATGPDLVRAICGSEGTLAIITSAVLRVHRAPEARFLSAHVLPTFDDAISAVNLSLRDEAIPAAVRLFDRECATRYFGSDLGGAVLVAATAGPTDLAACDRDLISAAVAAVGGASADQSIAELWWQRRQNQDHPLAAPDLRVSAAPGTQTAVCGAVRDAASQRGFATATYASRFDLSGGIFYFLLTPTTADSPPEALVEAIEDTQSAAALAGAQSVDEFRPELAQYFFALRNQLDPSEMLNPHTLTQS